MDKEKISNEDLKNDLLEEGNSIKNYTSEQTDDNEWTIETYDENLGYLNTYFYDTRWEWENDLKALKP